FEQTQGHLLVDGVVLGHENSQRARRRCRLARWLTGRGPRNVGSSSEDLEESVVEERELQRLRQHGGKAHLPMSRGKSLPDGREQDERERLGSAVTTDLPSEGETTHVGHLVVEQNDVVRISAPDTLEPVL